MDFFDINVSEVFFKKHKEKVFNEIVKLIEKDTKSICDNKYIEIVFKFALFNFLGLSDEGTKKLIEDTMNKKIDIQEIKIGQKRAIKTIQRYLHETINNKK